jgi:hypothetical protein
MSSNMNRYDDQSIRYKNIQEYLTPDKETQAFLILQGKCPHNKEWSHRGQNGQDSYYVCNLCLAGAWY